MSLSILVLFHISLIFAIKARVYQNWAPYSSLKLRVESYTYPQIWDLPEKRAVDEHSSREY